MLLDKAKKISYHYTSLKEYKNDFVFPYLKGADLKDEKRVATRIKTITRNLNLRLEIVAEKLRIEKKLSMYIVRQSFGNTSGDKIPIRCFKNCIAILRLQRRSIINRILCIRKPMMQRRR